MFQKYIKYSFLLLLVAIISFSYGMITIKYQFFPYYQLKSLFISTTKNNQVEMYVYPYYLRKKSFFDVNGNKADIVMIGDSITEGAEWHELFPNVSIVNRGIASDTTQGLLHRMDSIFSTAAKKAFIMIGINDLGQNRSVDDIFANYVKVLEQLMSHNITPYIQSTILAGGRHIDRNKSIIMLNLRLKSWAEKNGLIFIDLNQYLAADGSLNMSFSDDGIHLNGQGYAVWKTAIQKFLLST
jgi:lysophospholipase L1-like esterase